MVFLVRFAFPNPSTKLKGAVFPFPIPGFPWNLVVLSSIQFDFVAKEKPKSIRFDSEKEKRRLPFPALRIIVSDILWLRRQVSKNGSSINPLLHRTWPLSILPSFSDERQQPSRSSSPPAAMVVREQQDPDIVRWGLHHLLQGGGGASPYCAHHPQAATTDYAAYPDPHHVLLDAGDGVRAPGSSSSAPAEIKVERVAAHKEDAFANDEVIAHALQEELAELALAEASSRGDHGEQHATVLAQQWFRPEIVPSAPPYQEAEGMMEPFSSCSSPGDNYNNAHDGRGCSIELVDDFSALDGEVGKRLNDMVPVPHVPKTNGEIPSVDEAFSDHQRLLDRLVLYGLVELKVTGDGNCQFRALSDQFYRTPDHHRFVRQEVVKQLESHPEIYAGYVPMDYREYLKKMPRSGEWGDHVTLQAAADLYGVKIFILTSFRDTCYIEILPVIQKSNRVICLSFWAEVHYNSIYPEGELPATENKKKRWWHF